jgi:hypothetical protein
MGFSGMSGSLEKVYDDFAERLQREDPHVWKDFHGFRG